MLINKNGYLIEPESGFEGYKDIVIDGAKIVDIVDKHNLEEHNFDIHFLDYFDHFDYFHLLLHFDFHFQEKLVEQVSFS